MPRRSARRHRARASPSVWATRALSAGAASTARAQPAMARYARAASRRRGDQHGAAERAEHDERLEHDGPAPDHAEQRPRHGGEHRGADEDQRGLDRNHVGLQRRRIGGSPQRPRPLDVRAVRITKVTSSTPSAISSAIAATTAPAPTVARCPHAFARAGADAAHRTPAAPRCSAAPPQQGFRDGAGPDSDHDRHRGEAEPGRRRGDGAGCTVQRLPASATRPARAARTRRRHAEAPERCPVLAPVPRRSRV